MVCCTCNIADGMEIFFDNVVNSYPKQLADFVKTLRSANGLLVVEKGGIFNNSNIGHIC